MHKLKSKHIYSFIKYFKVSRYTIRFLSKVIIPSVSIGYSLIITCYANKISNDKFTNYKPSYIENIGKTTDFITPVFLNKDWVNQQRPLYSCPGYYKPEVLFDIKNPEISADSSELAKSGTSILNGNVIYLDNKQKVSADRALIYRDDKIKKFTQLKVNGNVEYLTPEIRVVSNLLEADLVSDTANINTQSYFRYYPRNARGKAEKATLIKNKSYNVYDAMFTTCSPGNTDWKILSDEIKIDPKKQIATAKNTSLYFYDIPVFYTPYLRFPTSNQRESGLLMPLFSSSDRYGYSLATPYYFNLSPNYDMTITPGYLSKRGAQLLLETRHLSKFGNNIIQIEYLPNDNEFNDFKYKKLASIPAGMLPSDPRLTDLRRAKDERYALSVNDDRQWTEYFTTNIDYNHLSDNQYYIDLPRSSVLRQQSEDHILQQGKANYSYHNWRSEILVKGYQTLHTFDGPDLTEPYRILPSFSLKNDNIVLLPGASNPISNSMSIVGSIDSHATRFASPSNPSASRIAEGQRYYIKPSISTPIKKSYGYIIPKVAINSRYYDLNQLSPNGQMLGYNKNQDYIIPIYSIDSGLYFDKQYLINNNIYTHTLEPRLFYLNIPKKTQNQAPDFDIKENTISYEQLFRDNNFSGYDRQSNANNLTTGLVSRIQNSSTGHEYLKLQVGQSFLFQDQNTTICDQVLNQNCIYTESPDYQERLSPFITQLSVNYNSNIYGLAEWQWDYYLSTTKKINLGMHYNNQKIPGKSPQTVLNLEYNFLKEGNIQYNTNGIRIYNVNNKRNDLSEIESSFKLPIHENWNLLGFYSYDIRNQATLDRYFGAELQKCCWALRFGYRSQLRLRTNSLASKKYDNIFTVQFSLKGLGELNKGFENILHENIIGYQNQLDKIY